MVHHVLKDDMYSYFLYIFMGHANPQ